MTKKHFVMFAESISALVTSANGNKEKIEEAKHMAETFAETARKSNRGFDRARFMKACAVA